MKYFRQALLSEVGARVVRFGFREKPVGQSFLRPFSGGRASFHLAFIKHLSDFDVTADVAVRFDSLEELCFIPHPLKPKNAQSQTYSLGAELGNIAGVGQKRWAVSQSEDVTEIADQIISYFKDIGLPYIERTSTLEDAFALLTRPWREAKLHAPFHSDRAIHIIGLAKLLGKDDELPDLARAQLEMLESLNDRDLPEFKDFVAKLGITI